jgi:hypothetical protein
MGQAFSPRRHPHLLRADRAEQGWDDNQDCNLKVMMGNIQSLEAKVDAILDFFNIFPSAAPNNDEGILSAEHHNMRLQHDGPDAAQQKQGVAGAPSSAAEAWKNHKKMVLENAQRRKANKERRLIERNMLADGMLKV